MKTPVCRVYFGIGAVKVIHTETNHVGGTANKGNMLVLSAELGTQTADLRKGPAERLMGRER